MVRQSILFLQLICLALLLSPQASSQDRFEACHKYDEQIEYSVKKYWPRGFQKPEALKAQLYQESLCNPNALSPVGAQGIAQFMPATWREMQSIFGGDYSPRDPSRSIMYSAYYQYRQMKVWRGRGRTYEEQWPLGLCGYNAGTGNCLKAQTLSGGERDWVDFSTYLCDVTGSKNCHETQTYISRIYRWRSEIEISHLEKYIERKNNRDNLWLRLWDWIKG